LGELTTEDSWGSEKGRAAKVSREGLPGKKIGVTEGFRENLGEGVEF